jgi:hypothetical protein
MQTGGTNMRPERNPVAYVGPNIPRANLRTGDVFIDGTPAHVSRAIERLPEIQKLIVPVENLTAIKAKAETQGTEENRIYSYILTERSVFDAV